MPDTDSQDPLNSAEAARLLVESGLLFQINRLVLHPVGLALAVEAITDEDRFVGISGIFRTEDPEGMTFSAESMERGLAKYEAFLKANADRLAARKAALGVIVQEKAAEIDKI